jgi:hypothetical protein
VLVSVTPGDGLDPGPSEPVDGPPVTVELPLEQAVAASASTRAAADSVRWMGTGPR